MIITRDAFYAQRITPRDNRLFAAQQACVSLVLSDVTPLANQGIPIVLPAGPDALPLALIPPVEDDQPFGDHTPRLWQHYPFALTHHVVGIDAHDSGELGSILQGDPYAPHWADNTGYRLFDSEGQASGYLQKTLVGLREVQKEVHQTQQLIWQLHQLRVLSQFAISHARQTLLTYRIDMAQLQERIGASDDPMDGQVLILAQTVEQSQQALERPSYNPAMTSWCIEDNDAELG